MFLANVGTGLKKSFQSIRDFFKDSVRELKKVRWPSRKELISYTTVVITTVAFLTIFFVIIDLGISSILSLIGLGK
ncbi:preprotein translocase subunit SecE [Tepidibacillus fermentans]|uniref:Protein translocase subunit SecE n=1 Tax=Tepidibacillus fermentans TaxID=1281767 RepID=A0A4R3KE35_9BACI|nr:preprotein translocase subunit SecE [Tepidibacillus fermentans]TCS81564.1 protein translocase subunit secE/sec61 gamma [Tepidibacillus fermentans]